MARKYEEQLKRHEEKIRREHNKKGSPRRRGRFPKINLLQP